jgi:hypothetical protein
MKKLLFALGFLAYSGLAFAQWAVLDQSVLDIVTKIKETGNGKVELTKFATQAALNSTFQTIPLNNPEQYIGTIEDCGDPDINANHYNACLALRKLRLKTLEQTSDILTKIQTRKGEILTILNEGSGAQSAGMLQRAQFKLQGVQTQMQNDAMELEAVRYGYQQRAIIYETQMAEARRATDTRAPAGPGGFKITLPVPFPGK